MSKSVSLFLVKSGLTVYMRTGSTSGTTYAQTTCSDSNLVPGNIRNGVSIFGVTGSYICPSGYVSPAVHSAAVSAATVSGYSNAKSSAYITNGSINAASIAVYSGHYACNMSLTLNFGDGTASTKDVSGGVIVDDIVEYGKSIGGGGESHTTSYSMYCTEGGQVPGTSTYRYRFSIEFSSPRSFSSGNSYTFWR